jgi:hypothetical protein
VDEVAPGRINRVYSISAMPKIDLTDQEAAAVAALVRKTLRNTKFSYPYDPDLKPLKNALSKLDPGSAPKPRPGLPPLPSGKLVRSRRSRH